MQREPATTAQKCGRRNAADGTGQEHECQRRDAHPSKVDEERHGLGHLQLGEEVGNLWFF